jgi:hypothetical protein
MVRDLDAAYDLKKQSQAIRDRVAKLTLAKLKKYVYLKDEGWAGSWARINGMLVSIVPQYSLDDISIEFFQASSTEEARWISRHRNRKTVSKRVIAYIRICNWRHVTAEEFPYLLTLLKYLSGEYLDLDAKEDPDYVDAITELVAEIRDMDRAVKELRKL